MDTSVKTWLTLALEILTNQYVSPKKYLSKICRLNFGELQSQLSILFQSEMNVPLQ